MTITGTSVGTVQILTEASTNRPQTGGWKTDQSSASTQERIQFGLNHGHQPKKATKAARQICEEDQHKLDAARQINERYLRHSFGRHGNVVENARKKLEGPDALAVPCIAQNQATPCQVCVGQTAARRGRVATYCLRSTVMLCRSRRVKHVNCTPR